MIDNIATAGAIVMFSVIFYLLGRAERIKERLEDMRLSQEYTVKFMSEFNRTFELLTSVKNINKPKPDRPKGSKIRKK